jgi:hypothetical protein
MRTLLVIAALLTPVPVLAQSTCPTTASSTRQQFIPPAPNRAVLERGRFWHGSDRLWTQLREDGHWLGVYRDDLRSRYRNKLPLFRAQFDSSKERTPSVLVTARRLDIAAPSINAEPTHGVFNEDAGSLMMTALDLPGGCWQIEAQYANEPPLTFVVSVP